MLWLAVQIPREIGRWQLALAIQARLRGDRAEAERRLEAALRRFPDHPALLLQRAEWWREDGREEEALAQIARLREVAQEATSWLLVEAYFLQTSGKFEAAVPLWRTINQRSQTSGQPPRHAALNGLAYAMALAGVDLEEALALASEALRLDPDSPAILDTRGYILYRLGRHAEAVRDLRRAAAGIDVALERMQKLLQAEGLADDRSGAELLPTTVVDLFLADARHPAQYWATTRHAAAVIHYHLALAFAAMGRQTGAEIELQKARELAGREPDDSLF